MGGLDRFPARVELVIIGPNLIAHRHLLSS